MMMPAGPRRDGDGDQSLNVWSRCVMTVRQIVEIFSQETQSTLVSHMRYGVMWCLRYRVLVCVLCVNIWGCIEGVGVLSQVDELDSRRDVCREVGRLLVDVLRVKCCNTPLLVECSSKVKCCNTPL